jgi:hypothetical protein
VIAVKPAPRREGNHEIDERFMDEWLEFGWSELAAYLAKWARFSELYPDTETEEPAR